MRTLLTSFAVCLSVAAGASAACVVPATANAADRACDVRVFWSQPTLLHPVISADVTAACIVAPESHTLELSLEHVSGGGWKTWAIKVDSTVPYPSERQYEVSAECEAGDWRSKVLVHGSLQGRPFNFVDVGDTRTVTSSECPRG